MSVIRSVIRGVIGPVISSVIKGDDAITRYFTLLESAAMKRLTVILTFHWIIRQAAALVLWNYKDHLIMELPG